MSIELDNPPLKEDINMQLDQVKQGYRVAILDAICNPPVSLVDIQPAPMPVAVQRRSNMFDDDFEGAAPLTEAERTRQFFLNELYVEKDGVVEELRKQYRLDETRPDTFNDMVERIKHGHYRIKESRKKYLDSEMNFNPYSAADWFDWRTEEPDEKGYHEARVHLDSKIESLARRIRVAELKDLPELVESVKHTVH